MSITIDGREASDCPENIVLKGNQIELIFRDAGQGNMMACGLSTGAFTEPKDSVYTYLYNPARQQFMQVGTHMPDADKIDNADFSNHAEIVTRHIFRRAARDDIAILQLHARPLHGVEGVTLLAGVLQNGHNIPGAGQVFKIASPMDQGDFYFVKESLGADLNGMNLSQVQSSFLWKLGAETFWAPQVTMGSSVMPAYEEAVRIRDKIVTDGRSDELDAAFRKANFDCGNAVQGAGTVESDRFMRVLHHLQTDENGQRDYSQIMGIETYARLNKAMKEAVAKIIEEEKNGNYNFSM